MAGRNNAANRVAALLLLASVGGAPALLAQQYCVSGAVTAIQGCVSCAFNQGDPVAMTFTVKPGSVACITSSFQTICTANASFSANIGSRYWTSLNSQNPFVNQIVFTVSSFGGAVPSTAIALVGSGALTPGFATAADPNLVGDFALAVSGNLVNNNTLPATLPTPADIVASKLSLVFNATAGSIPFFSYTGNNCAAGTSSQPAPTIKPSGIVPIYSSSTTIQPGSWISIFGSNLAAAPTSWNNDFPTLLGGTSVTINNKPAYLWYVSPTQINLQAPDDTATGPVNVILSTPGGQVSSTVTLGQFGPSFSVLDGTHAAAIILRSDGSGAYGNGSYDIVGPTGTSLGYKTVAAKAGDQLELFGIGFGPTSPSVPAGKVFSGAAPTINPLALTINNVAVTPGFAGLTSAGLYQINVKLPSGLGSGDVPLRATAGGLQTPSTVVLSVQ